jgi:class 3 adenylate cyclase
VLFCDVVGSTSAGTTLDPEDVGDVLRAYHRTARSIVEWHGGAVEKFVGDGVFAVFGFPLVQ